MDEKAKITRAMTIEEVVDRYPQTVPVFIKHGLHCVGCHVAARETVEQRAGAHGTRSVEALVQDLTRAAG